MEDVIIRVPFSAEKGFEQADGVAKLWWFCKEWEPGITMMLQWFRYGNLCIGFDVEQMKERKPKIQREQLTNFQIMQIVFEI